jgi:hypothetical protein
MRAFAALPFFSALTMEDSLRVRSGASMRNSEKRSDAERSAVDPARSEKLPSRLSRNSIRQARLAARGFGVEKKFGIGSKGGRKTFPESSAESAALRPISPLSQGAR